MQLPMWQFRPQVLKAVDDNQVVIVCGETGWYVTVAYGINDPQTNITCIVERVLRYLRSCWNMNYPKADIARFIVQSLVEFLQSH